MPGHSRWFVQEFIPCSSGKDLDLLGGTLVLYSDPVLVWNTFLTDQEVSSISSAISIIGETMDNIWENEWTDEEQKKQYEQTMKYLGRISNRLLDKQGEQLV